MYAVEPTILVHNTIFNICNTKLHCLHPVYMTPSALAFTLSITKKTIIKESSSWHWVDYKDPRRLYSLHPRCLLINLFKLQGSRRNNTHLSKVEGETSCCLAYQKSAVEQKCWVHIYEGAFEILCWAIENVYLEISMYLWVEVGKCIFGNIL